jgi:hypothetical protein
MPMLERRCQNSGRAYPVELPVHCYPAIFLCSDGIDVHASEAISEAGLPMRNKR